jgi:hypothetical protein
VSAPPQGKSLQWWQVFVSHPRDDAQFDPGPPSRCTVGRCVTCLTGAVPVPAQFSQNLKQNRLTSE